MKLKFEVETNHMTDPILTNGESAAIKEFIYLIHNDNVKSIVITKLP